MKQTGSSSLMGIDLLQSIVMLTVGVLGDAFSMYLVFAVGSAISLVPMLYMCFHPITGEFVLTH